MRKILVYASVLALLDQLTKAVAEKYLPGNPLPLLEYSQNYGVAFGLDLPFFVIILFNLILIPAVVYFAKKEFHLDRPHSQVATVMLLAGALGNFIDRITHKYVVDFINIGPWPNFNLADAYISIAVLLIIVFHGKILRSQK